MAQGVTSVEIRAKRFGGQDVLRDIAFTLARGERLAVLGPSGVGKTTLLRLVAGLDTDFDGRIERPGRLAYVFQEPVLLDWRSVARNLELTTGMDDAAVAAALRDVGLEGRGDAYPRQLSLGQQRRVSLARALGAAPDLLILDEPFASLDEATADEMLDLTSRLLDGHETAALLVTHRRHEAERLGARIVRLEGRPATLDA